MGWQETTTLTPALPPDATIDLSVHSPQCRLFVFLTQGRVKRDYIFHCLGFTFSLSCICRSMIVFLPSMQRTNLFSPHIIGLGIVPCFIVDRELKAAVVPSVNAGCSHLHALLTVFSFTMWHFSKILVVQR